MALFDDFDDVVTSMMQEFGGCTGTSPNATYIKQVTGAYDTSTGSAAVVLTNIPVQAILIDYILKKDGLQAQFGSLVLDGDKMLYIRPIEKVRSNATPLSVNPTSDRIVFAGVTYKVVVVKEINTSGNDSILYEILIRR